MLTLTDLHRRLDSVRRRERSIVLVTGLARTVVVLLGSTLIYFLIDLIFELPYAGRLVAGLLLVSGSAWVFFKHVILGLRKTQDDDEIALRLEARNPHLRGRLISTIQLARVQKTGVYAGSPELLRALEAETLQQSAPLDFLKVLNRDTMLRLAAVAAAVLIVKAACLFQFPEYFEALALRMLNPDYRFPTRTRILRVSVPPQVARGDEVRVTVALDPDSVIPDLPGTLFFRSIADKTEVPVELQRGQPAEFTGSLSKAMDDLTVVASIGDARSQPETVRVLARPEVKEGVVRYHYPAYTGIKDPAPERLGGLSALQGATADLEITASKPLVHAELVRHDERRWPLAKADAEGFRWKLTQPLLIERSARFHFELKDADGLANSQPAVEYPIEAKADQPPTIRIKRPSKDVSVTPTAKPSIAFDVQDDFGVRALWLLYRLHREGQAEGAGVLKRIDLPPPPKAKDRKNLADVQFTWDLAPLGLKVGDQVTFWLEADDDCATNNAPAASRRPRPGEEPVKANPEDSSEPSNSRSGDVKLTVISEEEWRQEWQAEVGRKFEELRGTIPPQKDLMRKVQEFLEEPLKEKERKR